jgi:hypothetical protein
MRGIARFERWTRQACVLLVAFLALALLIPYENRAQQRRVLDAILQVESSGRDDVPDGDGGLAIGPYQIHEIYWRDAVAAAPRLGPEHGHSYQDCRGRAYAEQVVRAYMRRWIPDAWRRGEAETIARTHNGGPLGARKESTRRYWERVRRRLAAIEAAAAARG